jgi:acetoacetate decarboxylase
MLRRIFVFSLVIVSVLVMAAWPNRASAGAEDGYFMPTMAPDPEPPPIDFKDGWTMLILFSTTREVIRDLVPNPLFPEISNTMFVAINRYSTPTKYNEFMLGAMAYFEGKMVSYCAYLLVDDDIAMAAGREIWGYPKKMGRITLEEKDGKVIGTVERGGVTLVKATMELSNLIEQNQEPDPPFVNLKLIPSVQKNTPHDVWQLTLMKMENVKIHKRHEGNATLEFGGSVKDPLDKIPITNVMGGRYSNWDFTLPYGEVIHDYLKAE